MLSSTFLLLTGCEKVGDPAIVVLPDVPERTVLVEEVIPPENLLLSRVKDLDSLERALMPILTSDPAHRNLDMWLQQKNLWEPQVGGVENLLAYINFFYLKARQGEEHGLADKLALSKGKVHYISGNYPASADAYRDVLDNVGKDDNLVTEGWAYLGMALANYRMENTEQMFAYLEEANKVIAEVDDIGLQIMEAFFNVMRVSETGDPASMIPEMEDAIDLAQDNDYLTLAMYARMNLAYVHILSENYDLAIDILSGAIVLEGEYVSAQNAYMKYNFYEAYMGMKAYDDAYRYLMEGCEISEELEFGFGVKFCKEQTYRYYEALGDYASAFTAFNDYHELYQEQSGLEAQKAMEVVQARLRDQTQRLEIERLSRQETEQRAAFRTSRNWLYTILVLLFFVFLFAYQRLKFKNAIALVDQKKSIAESKLQVLQSQIHPHFIFNVITGIQNSILKSDPFKAYSYLGKFASLLRTLATTATTVHIDLDEEVKLVDNYLALEKLRFREGFVYDIRVAEELQGQGYRIPSMMIQPVLENAIIHGVSNLSWQGEIVVDLQLQGSGVKATVTDNGRGRVAAAKLAAKDPEQHLSLASTNREASINFLHDIGYEEASMTIIDRMDEEDRPAGTEVVLFLPFFKE